MDKWNPLMSDSESSASRLFRGNVLDAVSISCKEYI